MYLKGDMISDNINLIQSLLFFYSNEGNNEIKTVHSNFSQLHCISWLIILIKVINNIQAFQ